MESIRTRITLFISIFLILTITLLSWYSTLDEVDVIENVNREDLSRNEKIQKFGFTSVDKYQAYNEQIEIIKKTKTLIPFVYDKEVVSSSPTKLWSIGRKR